MNTRSLRYLFGAMMAGIIALVLFVLPVPVHAKPTGNTYIVNSTLDEPDGDTTDGICASFPSGVCTLRAAIMDANFTTGPHTITLPAATLVLTRTGLEDNALSGDLDIKQSMTIQGAGSSVTIVDGNGGVTNDRVFQILSAATHVTMTGMTIRNGTSYAGGGIYRDGSCTPCVVTPTLYLSDIIVENNTASSGGTATGGGIYALRGSIFLANSTLRNNISTPYPADGAGLEAISSTVSIQDSKVYSNSAAGVGGGLYLLDLYDSHIARSEIYSNTADTGSGMASFGASNSSNKLTMTDSYLHDNHANCCGGAIEMGANIVISQTTIDSNSAVFRGGGIEATGVTLPSTMLIDKSTISNNGAQSGGGIYYTVDAGGFSRMSLVNSTLSGNLAFHAGGGAANSSDGGGIYLISGAPLSVFNSTIARNVVDPGFGIQIHPARGGGVFITSTAAITLANTLIGNNVHSNFIQAPTEDDCFGFLSSVAYTLIQATTNCSLGPSVGNITGQDPVIDSLQNNGGKTKTHALQLGSPAIDTGGPGGCIDNNGAILTTDQRGGKRPVNGRCDIGAYEYGGLRFLYLPLIFR